MTEMTVWLLRRPLKPKNLGRCSEHVNAWDIMWEVSPESVTTCEIHRYCQVLAFRLLTQLLRSAYPLACREDGRMPFDVLDSTQQSQHEQNTTGKNGVGERSEFIYSPAFCSTYRTLPLCRDPLQDDASRFDPYAVLRIPFLSGPKPQDKNSCEVPQKYYRNTL